MANPTQFNLSIPVDLQALIRQRAQQRGMRGPSELVRHEITAYLTGDLTGVLAQLSHALLEVDAPVDQPALRAIHRLASRFLVASPDEATAL